MIDENIQRRMTTICYASAYCGLGRVTLYKLATINHGLFRKCGGKTLVDLRVLDKILDELPHAKIRVRTHGSVANTREQK